MSNLIPKDQKIFRPEVLARLSNPEELDTMIQVTNRKGWITLFGLTGVVVAALVWAIFGTIPTEMQQAGILLKPDGIGDIKVPVTAKVSELNVKIGDTVQIGQVLAKLRTAEGTESAVISSFDGTIVDLAVKKDGLVKAEMDFARIEIAERPLQGFVFAPLAEGKRLKPGMKVQSTPSTVRPQESGYLLGKITAVSQYPASTESMMALLGSKELVQAFASKGPAVRVDIEWEKDSNSVNGFKWSSPSGSRTLITNGTFFQANFVLGEQKPIELVFPILREEK